MSRVDDEVRARAQLVCSMSGVGTNPEAVTCLVMVLMGAGYSRPGIFPTDDGNVSLEWLDGLSLEVQTVETPEEK